MSAHNDRHATQMRYQSIGQVADPAPSCAKPKGEERPSLRDIALSVLASLASGRREW